MKYIHTYVALLFIQIVIIKDFLIILSLTESNIVHEKNIIQKMQSGVLSVMSEKKMHLIIENHKDEPKNNFLPSLILVKKVVALYVSMRLKHYCKNMRQTILDKNVRKKNCQRLFCLKINKIVFVTICLIC